MFTVHPNESTFEKVIVNHVQVREHEGIEYMTIKDFPDKVCADLFGRLPMLCGHIEVGWVRCSWPTLRMPSPPRSSLPRRSGQGAASSSTASRANRAPLR
jgi:hypothetical protein